MRSFGSILGAFVRNNNDAYATQLVQKGSFLSIDRHRAHKRSRRMFVLLWLLDPTDSRSCSVSSSVHMTTHLLSSLSFFTLSATRAASVKASLTPRFRMAEHSR